MWNSLRIKQKLLLVLELVPLLVVGALSVNKATDGLQ